MEQPPKSFDDQQSSFLARVLRDLELRLNNVIEVAKNIVLPGAIKTANLADGSVTQPKLAANVAGNGPLIIASQGAVSIPASTFVKMPWSIITDTNSCWSVANNRFTPNVAGYYQVSAQVFFNVIGQNYLMLMKNSTGAGTGRYADGSNGTTSFVVGVSTIVFMNGTTDYLECYVFSNIANSITANSNGYAFTASLLRAA